MRALRKVRAKLNFHGVLFELDLTEPELTVFCKWYRNAQILWLLDALVKLAWTFHLSLVKSNKIKSFKLFFLFFFFHFRYLQDNMIQHIEPGSFVYFSRLMEL